jgi:predicted DNA-binding transcriptional regulator YafY
MINLLALLVERSRPLTLKQIRRELGNQYSDQDEAARAAFERDKAELRKMGIPIEMVTLGGDQAGEGGYTIDRRSFLLADLKLTDAERAALELAIATVRMGAVVGEGALWKLGGERVTKAPATSVNVQLTDEVLRSLAAGVIDRKSLTFTYKSEKRTVDPYGLLARGGFWYLVGHDHLRGAQRVFRVDRIESSIGVVNSSFERPVDFDLESAVPTERDMLADGEAPDTHAVVRVDESLASRVRDEFGEAAVVATNADGSMDFRIPCANLAAFRSWLFAMVDRAEVLSPSHVRDHVVASLREMAGGAS